MKYEKIKTAEYQPIEKLNLAKNLDKFKQIIVQII